MEFRLLGPIELYDDVRRCRVELNGPKQRVLLATLLVRSGFVVTVEQLIEELWGSCPPAKAVNAVQAHVGRLRRLLQQHERDHTGPERLVTSRTHGYILLVEPGETDVDQFKQATTAAKEIMAEDPAVAAGLLRTALKLWRGGALEGDDLGAICATEANLLDEQRLNTLESLYDACLLANQHAEVVSELQGLSTAYPLRERFYDQLMVALYRCGRQAEALGVYETARQQLAAELGLEPAPELAQRKQEILSHSSEPMAAEQGIPRASLVPQSNVDEPRIPAAQLRQHKPPEVSQEIERLWHQVDRLTREHEVLARTVDELASAVLPAQRQSPDPFGFPEPPRTVRRAH